MTDRSIPKADMDAAIAAAEAKYHDLPRGLLGKMAQVESKYGKNLSNPSGARGPWQFMPDTGPQYGLATEEDRMDPYKSADAAARLMLDNKRVLEKKIGRPTSEGELYLAHQQGASGAAKLLIDPNANAASVVGAERVRQNLPDARKAEHTKLTTGEFAKLWTDKFDGTPPGKKSEPRAAGSLGALPSNPITDFYHYNPNSLADLRQRTQALSENTRAQEQPIAPVMNVSETPASPLGTVPKSVGSLQQRLTEITSPKSDVPTADPRSTAIFAGLSTLDKMRETSRIAAKTVHPYETQDFAPSGIGGEFSRGIDAGMAGMDKDREYFGAILDTLTGNEEGAKSHFQNAEMADHAAAKAMAGMPSFADFMKAPTFDGFLTQAVVGAGQVAPSALESIAYALVSGGTTAVFKTALSAGSRGVAADVVKDLLTRRVRGEVLDESEKLLLETMTKKAKMNIMKSYEQGALGGAFAQEFVMGSGEAVGEFKDAGVPLDTGTAWASLGIGVPQALVGAGSEAFVFNKIKDLAFKKSKRIAGDNVFKRFLSDIGGAALESGLVEGSTELAQEGISVAQRKSVDPEYDAEAIQLRLVQAAFAGFFGGGLFAGGAAAPAAVAGAVRRETVSDPNAPPGSVPPAAGTAPAGTPPGGTPPPSPAAGILAKTKQILAQVSRGRTEANIKKQTQGVTDSVLSGDTAPETRANLAAQYKEMMNPDSPRKAVWVAESNKVDLALTEKEEADIAKHGVIQQKQNDVDHNGAVLTIGKIPGKGYLISKDGQMVAAAVHNGNQNLHNEPALNAIIGQALGMSDTGGAKGDVAVQAETPAGDVVFEQTADSAKPAEVAAATQAAEAQVAHIPGAVVKQVPTEAVVSKRAADRAAEQAGKARVAKREAAAQVAEQSDADYFAGFGAQVEPAPVPVPIDRTVSAAEQRALREPVVSETPPAAPVQSGPLQRVYDAEGNEFLTTPENEQRNKDGSIEVQVERFGKIDSWGVGPKELLGADNPTAPDAVLSTGEKVADLPTAELTKRSAALRVKSREHSDEQTAHRRDFTRVRSELARRGVNVTPVNRGDQTPIKITPKIQKRAFALLKVLEPHVMYRNLIDDVYDKIRGMFEAKEVYAGDLDAALLDLELSVGWPRHNRAPETSVIAAMRDLSQLHAELVPHIIERDAPVPKDGTLEKLKETAAKLSKPEKRAVWELLKRLANANQGVYPAVVRNASTNPNALGSFNSLDNFLGFKTAGDPAGTAIPTSLVIMHELGHWAYYNTLSPTDRVEFWAIMEDYETEYGIDEDKLSRGLAGPRFQGPSSNARISPQEFFAQQFSYWAAQKMGLDKEQLTDSPSEEYGGKTYRQQLEEFFSKTAKYFLQIVEEFFGKNKVDPEMAALFDRVFGAEQVPAAKKDLLVVAKEAKEAAAATKKEPAVPAKKEPAAAARPDPVEAHKAFAKEVMEKMLDVFDKPDTEQTISVEGSSIVVKVDPETSSIDVIKITADKKAFFQGFLISVNVVAKHQGVTQVRVFDTDVDMQAMLKLGFDPRPIMEDGKLTSDVVYVHDVPKAKRTSNTQDMIVEDDEANVVMNDDGDTTEDTGASSEADMKAVEDELNAHFDEIDNEHAEIIGSYPKQKRERADKNEKDFYFQFTEMLDNLPPRLEYMRDHYLDYEDIMSKDMLNDLVKQMGYSPESVFAIRENEAGQLELLRRDDSTDPETLVRREAVRSALKTVAGFSQYAKKTGVWFLDAAKGMLYRGWHEVPRKGTRDTTLDAKGNEVVSPEKMARVPGALSNFYLVNVRDERLAADLKRVDESSLTPEEKTFEKKRLTAAAGAVTKKNRMLSLSGKSAKKGSKSFGTQGVKRLADIGVQMNKDAGIGFDGRSNNPAQKFRIGFESILKELILEGYALRYSPGPNKAPIDIRDFTRLQGDAQYEVVAIIDDTPYTMPMLFGVKLPFENSKSSQPVQSPLSKKRMRPLSPEKDAARRAEGKHVVKGPNILDRDPNDPSQQLTDGEQITKLKTVNEDGTRRLVEDARPVTRDAGLPVRQAPDTDEERALNEALKKRRGGFEEEAAQSAEMVKAVRGIIKEVVAEAREMGASQHVEDMLDDMPDDVIVKLSREPGKGNRAGKFVAEVSSPRFAPQVIKEEELDWAVARAHALANGQPENRAIQYNRLALAEQDHSEVARQKAPETLGVPAPKDQTTAVTKENTSKNLNEVKVLGKLGSMTSRALAMVQKHFFLKRPVTVMTLAHLKENFSSLVGESGPMKGYYKELAEVIADMELESDKTPYGRAIMGNESLIVLRDTPETLMDPKRPGVEVYNPHDAQIATILGHEFGHILFKQEYDNIVNGSDFNKLWQEFVRFRGEMAVTPTEYFTTKEQVKMELQKRQKKGDKKATMESVERDLKLLAFEEWFSDQVMAVVYNQAKGLDKPAKNGRDSRFKALVKAFTDFWTELNDFLGGRMKYAKEMAVDPVTGKRHEVWSFPQYMQKMIDRHAELREKNREIPVETAISIRNMTNAVAAHIPANMPGRVASMVRQIMRPGTMSNGVTHKLFNLLTASTDFMGLTEHGQGGQQLKKFFGTLSQSLNKLGWNKNKTFKENEFNTVYAKILGITRNSPANEIESQRVTDIVNEAADDSIPTANLSTQAAKDLRDFFAMLMQEYNIDPATGDQWVEINILPNYGGSRMYNVPKIAENKDAFIAWMMAHPQNRSSLAAVTAAVNRIIAHNGDGVTAMLAEIENDVTNGVIPDTALSRGKELFLRSMDNNALLPAKNKALRDASKGAYSFADLLRELQTTVPNNAELQAISLTGTDAEIHKGLNEVWRVQTERMRLTPGMDPALSRNSVMDAIGTRDFRNADPNDPNGWLIPQAKANSQYIHFLVRKVEYEKMGGYGYVSGALNSIPEQYRQEVDDAIMANLGKFGENIGPKWRAFNSVASVWTVYTTLLFAALTSVTDLASIAIRSKDMTVLGGWFKAMKEAMTNAEWKDFSDDIGVTTYRSLDHAMVGQGELDYANQTSRALMNGFFRYTGLEAFTRFSRTMAVGMGRQFIIRTAERQDFDPIRHARWLAELGLTREDVQTWIASNHDMSTDAGVKVRSAIARFADEAVIRPDASQRPTWASSPYFQAVWQLKSYYYGFGKTVMGGMGREIKNRYNETGSFQDAACPAVLTAITILPLTMLGMSSRDWLRWLLQLAIPGLEPTPFRTDNMNAGQRIWDVTQRTGVFGPFTLALSTMDAFKWEGIAAPFTANVPMFDLLDDSIFDGDWTRPIPVLNNIK